MIAQSSLEIVGIVRGRDLHRAGAELGIREQVIGDDRYLAIHQRQQDALAVQMLVALVGGIYRNRRVAQHGLGTRGRNHDVLVRTADHRITNLVELARRLFVHNFQIGHRGDAARTPVHDVLAAIDQPFFIQPDEGLAHGARHALVHGEVLARPIHRGAEPLHLLQDGAAVMLLPVPDALDERFTAHIAAVLALAGELALHHQLRRDSGVVGAGQPERGYAAHALPADDDVDLGVLQHVAHVEVAGDIRRRQRQGERRLACARRRSFDVKQLLFHPVLGPARLNRSRLIGFGKIVRHEVRSLRR